MSNTKNWYTSKLIDELGTIHSTSIHSTISNLRQNKNVSKSSFTELFSKALSHQHNPNEGKYNVKMIASTIKYSKSIAKETLSH